MFPTAFQIIECILLGGLFSIEEPHGDFLFFPIHINDHTVRLLLEVYEPTTVPELISFAGLFTAHVLPPRRIIRFGKPTHCFCEIIEEGICVVQRGRHRISCRPIPCHVPYIFSQAMAT
jgi:hypothetical protein